MTGAELTIPGMAGEALAQTGRTAEEIAEHINALKAAARTMVMSYAIQIGGDLLEVKAIVPHGEWGEWLKTHVGYSERTAQQLMQVAKEYGTLDSSFLEKISYSQAVAMVSLTQTERENLLEEHADDSVRELEEAVKSLKAEKASMQVTIDSLMADYEKSQSDHEAKVSSMDIAMGQLRAQLDQLMEVTGVDDTAARKAEETRKALEEQVNDLNDRLIKMEDEKDSLVRQLQAQRESFDLDKEQAAKEAEQHALEKVQAELDEAKSKKDVMTSIAEDVQKKLRASEDTADELREHLKATESTAQKLREELKRKEAELKEARANPQTSADSTRSAQEVKYRVAFEAWQTAQVSLLTALTALAPEIRDKYRSATLKALEIITSRVNAT